MTEDSGRDAITDVPGIKVGHWTDRRAATGCTVVLCEGGAIGGVDVRGAAPGTRETDLLRPGNTVQEVHAVVLSGGSAYGLAAASGVMRYLEERGVGYEFAGIRVPIVPAAILNDLRVGRSDVRPDAEAGYRAARAAKGGRVAQGSVGAGTGATVAKALAFERCLKGGVGSASERAYGGLVMGALVAVNAGGDIIDSSTGQTIAGPRAEGGGFECAVEIMREGRLWTPERPREGPPENTTIGVVATNAALSKEQTNRLATVAHDGVARAVRPAHLPGDGDAIFALATGEVPVDARSYRTVEALTARALERAILRAVLCAESLAGIPSVREWTARS